jgi:hypothetical protein
MMEPGGWVACEPFYGQYDIGIGMPGDEIWTACYRISNTCEVLDREAVLQSAKEFGFVPD